MAQGRMLKGSIRTSKKVNALSDFQFRVWAYLITYVDDYGRGSADPELLKGLVFPRRKGVTEAQISEAITALANAGMVNLYNVDGESYLYFPKWDQHQRIRTKTSEFPEPAADCGESRRIAADCGELSPEVEEEGEVEEKKNVSVCRARVRERADEKDAKFEAFWSAFPRKNGGDIREAFLEFTHVVDDLGVDVEVLIIAAREQAAGITAENERYFPSASKWLRNHGWEQKPKASASKKRVTTFLDVGGGA